MVDSYELMERMQARIDELPVGYISTKQIKGKTQYYRQWREDGKIKSKYVSARDIEEVRSQIEERKRLELRLRELRKKFPRREGSNGEYKTNVLLGKELQDLVRKTRPMQKRDCYEKLKKYLHNDEDWTRVCVLYGLRRTGKTTMLFQAMDELMEKDPSEVVYTKMRSIDVMNDLVHDLKVLRAQGVRYVFVDEVTLMDDFIDSAALLSDLYAAMGMKIVLSGTDSLGFWLAKDNELYDRVRIVHTTFVPFREYSRLLGINSIDEYIRYGGLLRQGELAFDDEDANAEEASFRDEESTRRYVDTAISRNIQHSLACCEYGHYFGPLRELYEADELTNAINRVVEDMNHRFVVQVMTRDFVSNDLGLASHNLKRARDPERQTDILDAINAAAVTKKLMEILDIRNKSAQTIEITPVQTARLKEYLKALELIVECPIQNGESGIERENRILFTQPGMRYCQAEALVYSLLQDEALKLLSQDESAFLSACILEAVRGRMLEDIVLLETRKALSRSYDVFQYRFLSGEFDMLIRNSVDNTCAVYEIKHSTVCVPQQARHLRNDSMLSLTERRMGKIVGRYVLYLGEDLDTEDGIAYRNAEHFLKNLPEVEMVSGLEKEISKADA